jgi:hypothetical protein
MAPRWRFGRGMKDGSGLFPFRPFQHSADREDPAGAVALHRLLTDEARSRGAGAAMRSSSIPRAAFASPHGIL